MTNPVKTPLARMNYLIKRRASTSREELLVHWFANHMPGVIKSQTIEKEKGNPHAKNTLRPSSNKPKKRPVNPGTEWHNFGGKKN